MTRTEEVTQAEIQFGSSRSDVTISEAFFEITQEHEGSFADHNGIGDAYGPATAEFVEGLLGDKKFTRDELIEFCGYSPVEAVEESIAQMHGG